ncbi:MAG: CC/Se motif family (seleno)protein [Gemmatimonadota bacterium]
MIRIQPDAREHIQRNGGTVTLRGSRRHGCCGGTAFVPVAEPGRPNELEDYRSIEVDGITVFLQRDVETGSEPLVIGLDELWRLKRLRVEGTAIWM